MGLQKDAGRATLVLSIRGREIVTVTEAPRCYIGTFKKTVFYHSNGNKTLLFRK